MKNKKTRLSYQKRKSLCGYGFIGIWLVGTLVFFLIPLIKSLIWSFCDVTVETGRTELTWKGFDNFIYAFTVDSEYTTVLGKAILETMWKTPLIVIFSLFIAVILNDKFKGRTLARAVFFLLVIIVSGPVYAVISGDLEYTGNIGTNNFSTMFSNDMIGKLLQFLGIYGISDKAGQFIIEASDYIFSIVWSSGIQILLFLSALQNIPPSAREAALIEGASGWEYFWKITFPYVSPFILVATIFTVADSFTGPSNPVMKRIIMLRDDFEYGLISSMAWIYFGIIIIILGIVVFTANKLIYYEVE